jgi:hypothetical protein
LTVCAAALTVRAAALVASVAANPTVRVNAVASANTGRRCVIVMFAWPLLECAFEYGFDYGPAP